MYILENILRLREWRQFTYFFREVMGTTKFMQICLAYLPLLGVEFSQFSYNFNLGVHIQENIYLFKFNNRDTRKRFQICLKLTKISERRH